ncbi:MAG: DUF4173 domain-containing protein [Lachnospiraceae bacterium]|nr:DUF4173 domain-containing protein [Lachnospiraceae bacterium]
MTESKPMTAADPAGDAAKEAISQKPGLNPKQLHLKAHFNRYGSFSLAFGILGAFCFYRNPNAVTYPLFVAAAYLAAYRLLPSLGFPVKKDSAFLAAGAMVLAVNSCFTASPILHLMNHGAQLLLGAIFLLHQCFDDRRWSIGRYLRSITGLFWQTFLALPLPFSHLAAFVKSLKTDRSRNAAMLLAGFAAGIPAVLYLAWMLADADAVFSSMLLALFTNVLNPGTLFCIVWMILAFALGSYCLLGAACSEKSAGNDRERTKLGALPAISFMAMIGLLYLFFCGIQVVYLFAGKGTLPGGMTYAQYARQGFFQLLTVAVLNLALVLNCLKYFQKHPALTALLTIISLCTYVMIASAAYRMILYVSAYALTFLRLFVLWFLGLLAVLMFGVLAVIFREHFPLFKWCLVSVTIAWCAFVWCCPDYQIARYNISRENGVINEENLEYLAGHLSADAAPAIADAALDLGPSAPVVYLPHAGGYSAPLKGKAQIISSLRGASRHYRPEKTSYSKQMVQIREAFTGHRTGLRSYNASQARAKKLVIRFLP